MVGWGILGAGGVAEKRMLPALKQSKNAELIAIMDVNLEKARELSEKFGAKRYYRKIEKFMDDEEIQAIYISTPPYLHYQHVLLSAQHGKHILCEKPMAVYGRECEEMIKICRENNIKLMVGFMMRFHPYHRKVKEILRKGMLGKIILIRAQDHLWYEERKNAWRLDSLKSGGGALADLSSHTIDLMRFLIGEAVEVTAFTDNLIFEYSVEDTATVLLKFHNGAHGIIDSSWAIPYRKNQLEIYGTKGTILAVRTIGPFNNPEMTLLTSEGEEHIRAPYNSLLDLFTEEIEEFSLCIQKDASPPITGEDGWQCQKIISAVYESSREKKRIKIR